MRYAISEGEKIEATPKAQGICPGCGADLAARCGTKKIWHWAHKGRRHCDLWWENETEWHREWKNHFPKDWQEVAARDDSGELHIADVKTPNGLVYEFQHSPIHVDEIRLRTNFYKSMVWIVDGQRRVNDVKQFRSTLRDAYKFHLDTTVYELRPGDRIFTRILSEWWNLGVPVAIDFGPEFGGDIWILREAIYHRSQRYRRRKLIWQSEPYLHAILGYFLSRKEFIYRLVNEKPLPKIEHDGKTYIALKADD